MLGIQDQEMEMPTEKSEQWTVVQFISTCNPDLPSIASHSALPKEEISVVPVKWLFVENNKNYCYWPNSKLRKNIKKAVDPAKEWTTYEVILLLQSPGEFRQVPNLAVKCILKFPISYQQAIVKEKKIEEESSENSDYYSKTQSRPVRKRKPKSKLGFVEMHSSDDSEIDFPQPPKIQKTEDSVSKSHHIAVAEIHAKVPDADDNESSSTRSITSTDLMPPPLVPSLNTKSDTTFQSHKESDVDLFINQQFNENVSQGENRKDRFTNNENEPDNGLIANIADADFIYVDTNDDVAETNVSKICSLLELSAKIDKVYKQTIENRILLERIMNYLPNTTNTTLPEVIKTDLLPTQPFKKCRDLLQYDLRLTECETSQKQLENAFYICGGESEKENIIRGLRKIISDELAKKCSWFSRKNNFAVYEMKSLDILKAAVRKNFPALNEKMFEKVVANWLRQANLRYSRAKTKNKNIINH